jgi:hypothetical protein
MGNFCSHKASGWTGIITGINVVNKKDSKLSAARLLLERNVQQKNIEFGL